MAGKAKEEKEQKKERTIEELFSRMDEVLHGLEEGNQTLEETFLLYSEGMNLIKECNLQLEDVEKKIILLEGNESDDI
ncbi:MAG: exodeoxyribonuclease VII small subunit [Lachnospiraceae bacterium]|nr:exodeoxyribonuclease VII small subunit [Lachnospiraceae bacterium]